MKLLSLFSGIGAFEKALALNNMDYELVNYCEIDKYASKAYSVIHNVSEDLNLKDVRTVDTTKLNDIDLITYGFPCQDISNAGKQKGFVDDNGNVTRSGLFFEALRIIIDTQPKVAIAENVKALTTKKFADEFGIVLHGLDNAGYNNYWAVLNAKDYGIPQNRERVFIISIRKDIDNGSFSFPMPITLDKRLKDVLEKDVDEKFYLKDTKDFFIKNSLDMERKGNGFRFAPHVKDHANIAKTITTRAGGRMDDNFIMDIPSLDCDIFTFNKENVAKVMQIGNIKPKNSWDNPQYGRVYNANGISPSLLTMQGGNRQPKIVIERMTKQAYETLQENECKAGDVINPFNKRVVNDGLCPTLTTRPEGFKTANLIVEHTQEFRIRKLTPLECWRLMGFTDDDCNKVKALGISNSQLYKMAGNSICVSVLQAIFRQLKDIL